MGMIEQTVSTLKSDPKKMVLTGVAGVVLVVGLVLIGRSLFAGPKIGSVNDEPAAEVGADGTPAASPMFEQKMDPKRGQRQGNRYLAPSGN